MLYPSSRSLAVTLQTGENSENRHQRDALKAYEKKYKRPNHAVESAYLAQDILKQTLVPLLQDNFLADTEQIKYICHTVIMAAGRHHSAWAGGWEQAATAKIKSIELHPEAKQAIADSWRSIHRCCKQRLFLFYHKLPHSLTYKLFRVFCLPPSRLTPLILAKVLPKRDFMI